MSHKTPTGLFMNETTAVSRGREEMLDSGMLLLDVLLDKILVPPQRPVFIIVKKEKCCVQ